MTRYRVIVSPNGTAQAQAWVDWPVWWRIGIWSALPNPKGEVLGQGFMTGQVRSVVFSSEKEAWAAIEQHRKNSSTTRASSAFPDDGRTVWDV